MKLEKSLTIPDILYARNTLSELSYYSLINGYKNLFKHAPSGKYRYGVTFEEIACFYFFDEELRTLFLKYILHVERPIKSLISYYERLYSFHVNEAIPDLLLHAKFQIPLKNGQYISGKHDLFAVVIALHYLISKKEFNDFKCALSELILVVLKNCPHITKEQLFSEMGFPSDYI